METLILFISPTAKLWLWVASILAIGFTLFIVDLCLSFISFVKTVDAGAAYNHEQCCPDEKDNAYKRSILVFIGLMLCAWPIFLNALFIGNKFNFLGIGIVVCAAFLIVIIPRLLYVIQALVWFPIWWNSRRSAEDAGYLTLSPGMLLLVPLIIFGRIEDFSGAHGPGSSYFLILVSFICLGLVMHYAFFRPIRDKKTAWEDIARTLGHQALGLLVIVSVAKILDEEMKGRVVIMVMAGVLIGFLLASVRRMVRQAGGMSGGGGSLNEVMNPKSDSKKILSLAVLLGLSVVATAHSGMDRFVVTPHTSDMSSVAVDTLSGTLFLIGCFALLALIMFSIIIPWVIGLQTLRSNMSKVKKQATMILLLVGLSVLPYSAHAEVAVQEASTGNSWGDIVFLVFVIFGTIFGIFKDVLVDIPKDPKPGTFLWRILNS